MFSFLDFDWQWIVLDGPIDSLWIENLNTVLDETRTLCLANSERISLTNKIRIVFEADSHSVTLAASELNMWNGRDSPRLPLLPEC